MENQTKTSELVASTGDIYNCTVPESWERERGLHDAPPQDASVKQLDYHGSNYFKSAQWSPDGTSILTSSADNTIRTFIIPPDLLTDTSTTPLSLTPYTTHTLPNPTNCLAPYPDFTLSDPSTTLYLTTPNNLPTRLCNILSPTPTPIHSYALTSPTTEAYLPIASIIWSAASSTTSTTSTFLTGTDSLIALFGAHRPSTTGNPLVRLPTIPSKRHKMKGGGVGMRGIVSALSLQPDSSLDSSSSILAAGTWTRHIGLYDAAGLGGTIATWSIASAADADANISGAGVSQVLWSPCGRYLCVVERMSRGILIYDVRVTGKLVAWLEGREAVTNQRLGVDVFRGESGMEVWAGGTDGVVRVWEGVGLVEGGMERSWEWKAHDDPVTSTIVHASGTVVATSSGQRSFPFSENKYGDDASDTDSDSVIEIFDMETSQSEASTSSSHLRQDFPLYDNSIKIWKL